MKGVFHAVFGTTVGHRAAEVVDGAAFTEGHEPSQRAPLGRGVVIRLTPEFKEAFLKDIFRGGVIVDSAHDGALEQAAIAMHECFQCVSIALLDGGHEFFIWG